MRSGPPIADGLPSRRRCAAYTLAETLAAMLFLAIVIPTAVEALHIASRAGSVASRRSAAARIAERVLNESILYTNLNLGSRRGSITEGSVDYQWTITQESWIQNTLPLLTAEVHFLAQGQDTSVRISTLGNPLP